MLDTYPNRSPEPGQAADNAHRVAQAGFPVFPCREKDKLDKLGKVVRKAKSPLTTHGFKDATKDRTQIGKWWRQHPQAMHGVPTGRRTNLLVIDQDPRPKYNGIENFENLCRDHDIEIPKTPRGRTPSGGVHLLFQMPAVDSSNFKKEIAKGVDIKHDGGYIIFAGSRLADGREYEWEMSPDDVPFAPLPDGLLKLIQKPHNQGKRNGAWRASQGFQTQSDEEARIADALKYVSGVDDYYRYLDIGMALHDHFGGSRQGFSLWCQWASNSTSKFTQENAEDKWRSFSPRSDGIKIGTLLELAEQGGWCGLKRNNNPQYRSQGSPRSPESGHNYSEELDGPYPLISDHLAEKPFPVDALGETLGGAARAIRQMIMAPLSLCGNSVLAAAAATVQGHYDVEMPFGRKNTQTRPCSEYFATIAETGERKSGADREATMEMEQWELDQQDIYRIKYKDYLTKKEAYDQVRKTKLAKHKGDRLTLEAELNSMGDEPKPPLEPIFLFQDTTSEGLQKQYVRGVPSGGIFTAEGGLFLSGHSMDKQSRDRTIAIYNLLWDGKAPKRTRTGDGTTLLDGKRLSIHMMIQEEIARDFFRDRKAESQGFLSRFLPVWPESTRGTRFHEDATDESLKAMERYEKNVRKLLDEPLPMREGTVNSLAPAVLSLDKEAKELWVKFQNHIESHLKPDDDLTAIKDFADKSVEHAIRLAGILTVFDHSNDEPGGESKPEIITADYLQRGLNLTNFYLHERARILGIVRSGSFIADVDRLRVWLIENWLPGHGEVISLRLLCQYAIPKKFRPKKEMEKALAPLIENKWLVHLDGKHAIDGKDFINCYQIRRPI